MTALPNESNGELTVSERLFAAHCAGRGIACERIPEGPSKRPDYRVVLPQVPELFVEVKQLKAKDAGADVEDVDSAGGRGAPWRRARDAITKGYPQLRPYRHSPGVIVLYNNADLSASSTPSPSPKRCSAISISGSRSTADRTPSVTPALTSLPPMVSSEPARQLS